MDLLAGDANKKLWNEGILPGSPEACWKNLSDKDKSIWGAGKVPRPDRHLKAVSCRNPAGLCSADTKPDWPAFFDHDIIEIVPDKAVCIHDGNGTVGQVMGVIDCDCFAVFEQLRVTGCNADTAKLPPGGSSARDKDIAWCECAPDSHQHLLNTEARSDHYPVIMLCYASS